MKTQIEVKGASLLVERIPESRPQKLLWRVTYDRIAMAGVDSDDAAWPKIAAALPRA